MPASDSKPPPEAPPGMTPVVEASGCLVAYRIHDLQAFCDALAPTVQANLAAQADAEPVRSGEGWEGRLEGACPVQGYGTVDGLPWYFRARGETWSWSVAATPTGDPVTVGWGDPPQPGWRTSGSARDDGTFAASWMPCSEAWAHIEASLAAWRATR